jgi:hypothetical protein
MMFFSHIHTGSTVRVTVTLYPSAAYQDYSYYRYSSKTQYTADISDSKYHTSCFCSFDAIPDEEQGNGYSQYYYRAATGILLFGVATYVTMKRKVICSSCNSDKSTKNRLDNLTPATDHYKNATEDYDIGAIDYNAAEDFDAASIDATSERL